MRRVALLLSLLVFAAAGCAQTPADVGSRAPPPRHVDLFGDSLAVSAHTQYDTLASGRFDTAYNAIAGTTIADWQAQVLRSTAPTLVLALGTNDWTRVGTLAVWRDTLSALTPTGRCIVWVRIADSTPALFTVHEATAEVISHFMPPVKMIDWRTRAVGHPEWFGPDGIHYTPEGNAAYAQALVDAAGLCSLPA